MKKALLLSIIIITSWLGSYNYVNANISALSQGLKKKSSPKVKTSHSSPKRKAVKARAQKTTRSRKVHKAEKLETAVLWHAPPFKHLAKKLSPHEEAMRDLRAIEILSDGAAERYPQIKKAKRILSKEDSNLSMLAKGLLSSLNYLTVNLDLSGFSKVRSKEQAAEVIEQLNKYLYANYNAYKRNFFINDMRNPKFKEQISVSKANLVVVAGENSLRQVDDLFLQNTLSYQISKL